MAEDCPTLRLKSETGSVLFRLRGVTPPLNPYYGPAGFTLSFTFALLCFCPDYRLIRPPSIPMDAMDATAR